MPVIAGGADVPDGSDAKKNSGEVFYSTIIPFGPQINSLLREGGLKSWLAVGFMVILLTWYIFIIAPWTRGPAPETVKNFNIFSAPPAIEFPVLKEVPEIFESTSRLNQLISKAVMSIGSEDSIIAEENLVRITADNPELEKAASETAITILGKDPRWYARVRAAEILAHFPSHAAIIALAHALQDENTAVTTASEKSLIRIAVDNEGMTGIVLEEVKPYQNDPFPPTSNAANRIIEKSKGIQTGSLGSIIPAALSSRTLSLRKRKGEQPDDDELYPKPIRQDRSEKEIKFDAYADALYRLERQVRSAYQEALQPLINRLIGMSGQIMVPDEEDELTKLPLAKQSEKLRSKIRTFENRFSKAYQARDGLRLTELNREVVKLLNRRLKIQLQLAANWVETAKSNRRRLVAAISSIRGARSTSKRITWEYGWQRRRETKAVLIERLKSVGYFGTIVETFLYKDLDIKVYAPDAEHPEGRITIRQQRWVTVILPDGTKVKEKQWRDVPYADWPTGLRSQIHTLAK